MPTNLRRGRWEELDPKLVSALMLQVGLLRDEEETTGGRARGPRQPISHEGALPPGFGTLERNGTHGARVGARGKIQGARSNKPAPFAHPTESAPTVLTVGGGYANGHPTAGQGAARPGRGKPGVGKPGAGKPGMGRSGAGKPGAARGGAGRPAGANAASGPNQGEAGKPRGPRPPRAPGVQGPSARPGKPAGPRAPAKTGAGPVRTGSAPKSAKPRSTTPRGDDWQPSGASAHESRLGFTKSSRGGR